MTFYVCKNKTPEITKKTSVNRIKSLAHNPIHTSKYLHMDIGSITQNFLRIATCIFLVSSTLRKDSFHAPVISISMRPCKMKVYGINIAKMIWIGKPKSRLLIVTESCTSNQNHRQIGAFVINTK